jgi:GlcNAc-PI de-N-acetylase
MRLCLASSVVAPWLTSISEEGSSRSVLDVYSNRSDTESQQSQTESMRDAAPLASRLGLLVTAHPDDETMFFAPTLIALRPEYTWHILCLSTGAAATKHLVN